MYLFYWKIGRILLQNPDAIPAADLIEALRLEIRHLLPPLTVLAYGAESRPLQHWDLLVGLFSEGGDFLLDLESPAPARCTTQAAIISEARDFIGKIDAPLARGMEALQAVVILAEPGPAAREAGQWFGSATTFFFRGGSIINAAMERTFCAWVVTLIHEYAHAELFVLSQNELMCTNTDQERYSVLIRRDPRPMNGILHSFYVAARLVAFLDAAIRHPMPWRSDRDQLVVELQTLRSSVQELTQSSLGAIQRHGRLTALGHQIMQICCDRLELSPQPAV